MDGIYIIAVHDVAHDVADILARLGIARIEIELVAVLHEQLGVFVIGMSRRKGRRSLGLGTVGINPGMQLHTSLVTLGHHELEGVPHGRGRLSLHAGQETAPRLVGRRVERITLGPHLENDGIDARLLQMIQLAHQGSLHGLHRHSLKLSVHTLYPCASKLALGR